MTARNRTIDTNKALVHRIPTEIFDEGNTDLVDGDLIIGLDAFYPAIAGFKEVG